MTNTTNTAAASFVITKHYAKRDPEAQGDHYINHLSAMTGEGLHAKSDIAAELAHRDIEIDRLRAALAAPAQAVPASVITAAVMRDDGGEHPAFCLMVAYRAEKDATAALAMLTDEPAQPVLTDAYVGAREDLAIWKKRALEAEALNRKFAASVNGPTFMGEPVAWVRKIVLEMRAMDDAQGDLLRRSERVRMKRPADESEYVALYAAQAAPVDAEPLWRTDAEIVEQTEILARYLLSWKWGLHPESPDAQLRNSQSTKAQKAWNAACEIQDLLTATDVENAVAEVDDAARAAQGGDK